MLGRANVAPRRWQSCDGVLLGGVRLEACEIVEKAQCLGVESSGCCGDHRHEPVVLSAVAEPDGATALPRAQRRDRAFQGECGVDCLAQAVDGPRDASDRAVYAESDASELSMSTLAEGTVPVGDAGRGGLFVQPRHLVVAQI